MLLEDEYVNIEDEEEDEEEEKYIREKAVLIVDKVVKETINIIGVPQKEEDAKYKIPNIIWMICKDFTIGNGLLQIEEYMRTWELHESWLHWTNYLSNKELQYSTQYHYRVRWSIPTCRKPIPRATACVYFIIEISKIKPSMLPIEVFFVLETNKLIHRPGESRFKEKWLKDIIESKISMMETVDF